MTFSDVGIVLLVALVERPDIRVSHSDVSRGHNVSETVVKSNIAGTVADSSDDEHSLVLVLGNESLEGSVTLNEKIDVQRETESAAELRNTTLLCMTTGVGHEQIWNRIVLEMAEHINRAWQDVGAVQEDTIYIETESEAFVFGCIDSRGGGCRGVVDVDESIVVVAQRPFQVGRKRI